MINMHATLQHLENRMNEHFQPSVEIYWDNGQVIRLSWADQLDIDENERVIRQIVRDCFHDWPDMICFPAYSPMIHHTPNIFIIELDSQ